MRREAKGIGPDLRTALILIAPSRDGVRSESTAAANDAQGNTAMKAANTVAAATSVVAPTSLPPAAMIFGPFVGELARLLIPLTVLAIPISLRMSVIKTKGRRRGMRQEYIARIKAYVRDIMSANDTEMKSFRG